MDSSKMLLIAKIREMAIALREEDYPIVLLGKCRNSIEVNEAILQFNESHPLSDYAVHAIEELQRFELELRAAKVAGFSAPE